ncbi:MAG TPA: glycoside hydrolase family 43 protein, partial [Acidimicrobiia bacterium]
MPLLAPKPRRGLRIAVAATLVIAIAIVSTVTVRDYQRDQHKIHAARAVLDQSLNHEARLRTLLAAAHTATEKAIGATADHKRGTLNEQASTRHVNALIVAALADTNTAEQTLQTSTLENLKLGVGAGQAKACLGAEQGAMQQLQSGNRSAAVSALNSGAASCSNALADATGAAFPYDFPDPSVITVGGRYYGFSTNSGAGDVQVITSTDLVHWSFVGNALPALPAWASAGSTWAPAVIHLGATAAQPAQPATPGTPAVAAVAASPAEYVMYYTVRDRASGANCLSTAVSGAPTGPYVDSSTASLVCESGDGGSIDPSPFIAPDGSMWLLWKRERAVQPATIRVQQLNANGLSLTGPGFDLLQPDRAWERGVVEAPSMIHTAAGFVLFFAGGVWNSSSYGTGVALCNTPIGPCRDLGSPVLTSNGTVIGPGGASVFTDTSGAVRLAYASYV